MAELKKILNDYIAENKKIGVGLVYLIGTGVLTTEEIYLYKNHCKDFNINNFMHCKNLTVEFVLNHLDEIDWDYFNLNIHPCIKPEHFDNHLLRLRVFEYCKNPNVNIEFVLKNRVNELDWDNLSRNPGINIRDIEKYMMLPWNWEYVSLHPGVTVGFITKYIHKPWHWHLLRPVDVNIDFIRKNKNRMLNWYYLSKTIDIIDIDNNMDLFWDFKAVVKNPTLKPWFLLKYKNVYCIRYATENMAIDPWFFVKHRNISWDWLMWCERDDITIDMIKKVIHLPLNWRYLSRSRAITMDDIEKNSAGFAGNDCFTISAGFAGNDYPWSYDDINKNPNLTFEFYIKHKSKLNVDKICDNDFTDIYTQTLEYYQLRKNETVSQCLIIKPELIEIAWSPDRDLYWYFEYDFSMTL